jgi:hypothetical protein
MAVTHWGKFFVENCVTFGVASAHGLQGKIADGADEHGRAVHHGNAHSTDSRLTQNNAFHQSADTHSFRRSYIVARHSSIDFADRQPRTGRPTDRYPLSKLIPFLSIRYRPTSE